MTVLASGSKGNSTVIASGRTRVLVDAGLSCRELMRRMQAAGEDPAKLDGILITHEHVDHVSGLAVLARRLGVPVYFTEATHRAWVRMLTPGTTMSYGKWLERLQAKKSAATGEEEESVEKVKADPAFLPKVEYFEAGHGFSVGDIAVSPFTIPHDAADPCGFVFEADGARMAIATDLGYVPPNVKAALKRIDVLLLESNHDLEMLRDGPYPWSVKQRVLSRVGHLSNEAAAEFLTRDYDGGARYIVLGHLSESNNAPELARIAAERAIGDRMTLLGNRIVLAMQAEPLPAICL